VAEGKAEEAASSAEQQVESYLAKLLTDTSFRCAGLMGLRYVLKGKCAMCLL
jgi:hypothetical protein